jgi:hypothetical protein
MVGALSESSSNLEVSMRVPCQATVALDTSDGEMKTGERLRISANSRELSQASQAYQRLAWGLEISLPHE